MPLSATSTATNICSPPASKTRSRLAAAYAGGDAVSLAIDGLQPEKGHETLYVVRELTHKRVWFAEALLSSATAEVQQLLARARPLG